MICYLIVLFFRYDLFVCILCEFVFKFVWFVIKIFVDVKFVYVDIVFIL